MPTILVNCGMEALFMANEMNEPIHVHAGKGVMECKFWQDTYNFEITISVEYNLTPQTRREIKKKLSIVILIISSMNGTDISDKMEKAYNITLVNFD
ncbi:MAG: hypothetical protein BWX87_01931 [Bacteroidetes bacterium ADurb.Bin123]|jgi:hypothetical protein|nr:DUF4160 domain-containing protein [Prolixibacteraceae bacterium]OQB79785.1 MAG: hypothetical protein BWX87_01931 [Bacteroidetes bacterium ADurb.Bin123]